MAPPGMLNYNPIRFTTMAVAAVAVVAAASQAPPYTPDWPSLDSRPTPQWWRDAKFGVSMHWGVYSVPAFSVPYSGLALGEWYWHSIGYNASDRKPGTNLNAAQQFHNRVYGAEFEYPDFVPDFKAELYDPAEWAALFKRSGAKWALLTTKHHDGFELWPSSQASGYDREWNAVAVGPKRDLLGDLFTALRAEGLKAGIYHSLFEWFNPVYRGSDPSSYVTDKLIPDLKELVNKYQPDDILVDGEWEHVSDFWQTKPWLEWLFNESPVNGTVAVNDRWGSECRGAHGGYYVCENGAYSTFCNASYGGFAHPISDHPWAYWATTCPQGSWGFSDTETSDDYQTSEYFVKLLVATVSEGGVLLLNLGPTHRGTIAAIQQRILEGIGDWLSVNGEAIYSTVPLARGSRAEDLVEMASFIPAEVGMNNVFGVEPATPEKGILYLGKTPSAAACQAACSAEKDNGCWSYTWHDSTCNSTSGGDYANMCYGRTDATWLPVPEAGHYSGRRDTAYVQYTGAPAGGVVYAHFDNWPSDGVLVLRKKVWPANPQASMLGLDGVELKCDTGSDGSLRITLPRVPSRELPSQFAWVIKLSPSAV